MASFPSALDSFAGFTSSHTLSQDTHAAQHNLEQGAIIAVETKVGTGSSTPTNNTVLRGNGVGTTTYDQVHLGTDISGTLPISQTDTISMLKLVYPVGCIYVETTGVNPVNTFGFGTWLPYGSGQVPVGFKALDPNFGTLGQTGGEVTHALAVNELPAHSHNVTDPGHTHTTTLPANSTAGGTGNYFAGNNAGSLAAPSSSNTTGVTIGNTGGGVGHNNLQPYVTVMMWQRTA